jgi:hypothetical protein
MYEGVIMKINKPQIEKLIKDAYGEHYKLEQVQKSEYTKVMAGAKKWRIINNDGIVINEIFACNLSDLHDIIRNEINTSLR